MATCTECGCGDGDVVQRSKVNHRQHKTAPAGAPESIYWTKAMTVVVVEDGEDVLCQTCLAVAARMLVGMGLIA